MLKKMWWAFITCLLTAPVSAGNEHDKNPFHGWWRKASKGNATDYGLSAQYIFINATNADAITVQGFDGTLLYAFESTDPSKSISQFPTKIYNDRVLGFHDDISVTATVNGITGTFPDDLDFYFVLQKGGRFDGLGFMTNSSPAENGFLQLSAHGDLYEKIPYDEAAEEAYRPWSTNNNAFISSSKRSMFEQLDHIIFEANTPALLPSGQADLLMAPPQRLALKDAILNEGVKRDILPLYTIHKTTKGSGTTTLFTKGLYPFVSYASTITLSGLTGDWAALNDIQLQVVGIYNTDNETVQEQAPFFLSSTRTYHILIAKDTSGLPEFDSLTHAPLGAYIVPSKVGPITEDSNYRQWLDAVIFYTQKVMQQDSHTGLTTYIESAGSGFKNTIDARLTKSPLTTWEDVTATSAKKTPSARMEYRYKASGLRGSLICPAYYLPFYITFNNIQLNEPFQQLGIPGSDLVPEAFPSYAIGTPQQLPILGYNVPFENYILPESKRWLYFRVKPNTPVTNAQQENVWTLAYDSSGKLMPKVRGYASVGPSGLNDGGKLGGSRLEGLMSPVPWGTVDKSIEEGFWSPFTNFDHEDPSSFNAGIINPAFVGGRKIGYLHTCANILHDPFFISLYLHFGNPELAKSNDPEMRKRQQYDAETTVIAELMRYFVQEQKVDAIILDNRINLGGFGTQSFYEAFGGPRLGGTSVSAFQTHHDTAYNVDKEIEVFGAPSGSSEFTIRKLAETSPWVTVRPDLMEERYPGSVFKNGPVIIVSSQSAQSGGDQFPRYFMGDLLDGNIGNGVQTYIVGTMHGLLWGYSDVPTSLIVDSAPNSSAPVTARAENLMYNEIAGVPTTTRINPTTGSHIKALIPVNSGLKGPIYCPSNSGKVPIKPTDLMRGALSTNMSDTVYFDFGYTGSGAAVDGTPYGAGHWNNPPIGIDQVAGFPGQPNPEDPSTLRDSWLEEALRVARLVLGDTLERGKEKTGERADAPSSLVKQLAARFKTIEDIEARSKKKLSPGKERKTQQQ